MRFTSVGIRETKVNLSKILKEVAAGAQVIITDRGRPVGKIVPVEDGQLPLAERIARMERRGWLEAGDKKKKKPLPPPLPLPESLAQKFLAEERER